MSQPVSLQVQSNELTYTALFEKPAFALWGDQGTVLARTYDAFHDLGITASDLSFVHGRAATDEGVVVRLGDRSNLTFKVDRLEASIRNYLNSDLEVLPEYFRRGEEWLRSLLPEHRFATRSTQTAFHAKIDGGSAEDALRSLGTREPRTEGRSRGHGVLYHFDFPDRSTQVNLVVDHSLSVAGGLFVNFGLIIHGDRIDHQATMNWGRALLNTMLQQIDLAVPTT